MENHPRFLANFLNEGVYLVDAPMMSVNDSQTQSGEEGASSKSSGQATKGYATPDEDSNESATSVKEPQIQEERPEAEQEVEEEAPASTGQEPASGDHEAQVAKAEILVLVNYGSGAALKVKDQLVLSNILKALSISIDDVVTINTGNSITDFQAILESYQPKVVLAFGLSTDYFSGKITLNEYQTIQGSHVVLAPPVAEIAQDRTLKQKFWANLKGVFS